MAKISASDVSKLRKATGAGMMDCKKALTEAEGDFDKAVEVIRKKGQAIANKRADRETTEGAVIAKINDNATVGAVVSLSCETDFVAKNDDFVKLVQAIADKAVAEKPADVDALKALEIDGRAINDIIIEQIGVIGEKLDLNFYKLVEAAEVVAYIHPGNKLATIVGFNEKVEDQVGKDIAMQIAAMAPVSVDKDGVSDEVIEKEKQIGMEQARQEGKPENLLEKIAMGKLNKFFKESTLLNQQFTKDNKKTVKEYLTDSSKGLTVTEFVRQTIG